MEFIPIKISQCGKHHVTVDDLLREFFRLSKSETNSTIVNLLENESTANAALLDFFKDIQNYKQELEEIKRAHESVTVLQQNPSEISCDDNSDNLTSGEKYFLIQPESLILEKSISLDLCPPECSPRKEPITFLPESTVSSSSQSTVKPVKLRKNALVLDTVKIILTAQPEVIEFYNCEARKTYQKRVILQNVTTQLTRYYVESQPPESPFAISIEENRELIAPGMNAKLFVQLDYDGLSEPEERLLINVPNGQSVMITMRVLRDPPVLQVLAQTCSILSLAEQSSESSLPSSMMMGSCSNESYSGSFSITESTSYGSSSTFDRYGQQHPSFDCEKCFVGEFVMISTLIKNVGGKGRFFIMSETDWCLLKIKDVTTNNMLIVPPFALWPAYFLLEPGEMLILYTYFFPETFGLQVDEMYIISDNCSVKTIEVIGDGVVFEKQSLEFNNNVKYQWFQTKNKELCTMRYMDLGVGDTNTLLGGTFTMTSKCDLDVHYRWEVSDVILCPSIYKITIGLGKTNFPVGKMSVEPSCGVFYANSTITFRVIADLSGVKRDRYRTTLRLIIEDLPRAAVPERFNFQCTESQNKRRLCENPVDINFEDIDVRFKCERMMISESSYYQVNGTIDSEKSLQSKSLADVTRVIDDSEFWQSPFLCAPDVMDDQQSSRSDQVCRFIKGYGTCDCCQATMISTAVLRPGSPLFLGVTTKFAIILCNRSSTRIKYWWSQPVGSDHSKMRIKFDPPDSIAPNSCRAVELKCLPLETGYISSIFIACQFDARNPVVLSIECVVRSLCVVFCFPPMTDETDENNYYARIDWNADEYVSKYDKKSARIQLFSMRSREEETIHVAKLNSDRSLGKSSGETDFSGYEEYEGDFSSIDDTNTANDETYQKATEFDDLRISHDFLNDSFEYEAESFVDESEHLRLLSYVDWYSEFLKKQFRYQPLVYEIRVNAHKTTRKRIYIQNDSPIASYFRIYVKNFWAHQALLDGQNVLLDSNELQTGIELRIEPNRGEINPHEKVHFDLVVSSTTWGVYTDQITVEIDYLPPFSFWIRVINDDPPIVYPAYKNSSIKVPTIRFTAFKAGYPLLRRKVLLENTSDVPLYVNWHCFLIDDDEDGEKPFNVVVDMVSPLINIYDLLLTDPTLIEAIERFLRCAYDRCDSDDDLAEVNEGEGEGESSSGLENSQNSVSSGTKCPSDLTSCSDIDSESDITPVSNTKPEIRPTDTEFQIALVPYYGKLVTDLFIITPKEVYLPPKTKKYIHIDIDTEKMRRYNGKACCKACGFIRIPPTFKYQDNTYHRKDGYFIDPMEVNLGCELRRPRFYLRSNKCDCTFEFHTKHFLQQATNKLRMAKKITFKNFDVEFVNVTFKIDKPFSVSRLLMGGKVICKNTVVVPPNECVLIRIKCFITENWVEEAKNDNEHDPHDVNSLTLSRRLKIIYKEGFCQYHEIYIKTVFPSLAISTTHLNFGNVFPGERKSLRFEIRNLSKWPQTFELQRNEKVEDFDICIDKALLAGKNQTSMDRLAVKVSFVPMNPGVYKETVKVISQVDGLVFDCILEGSSCA